MTSENQNPDMESALDKLVEKGSEPEPFPNEMEEQVWEQIEESIETGDLPETGEGEPQPGDAGTDGGSPDSWGDLSSGSEMTAQVGTTGSGIGGGSLSSGVIKAALVFAAGTGIGVAVYQGMPAEKKSVAKDRRVRDIAHRAEDESRPTESDPEPTVEPNKPPEAENQSSAVGQPERATDPAIDHKKTPPTPEKTERGDNPSDKAKKANSNEPERLGARHDETESGPGSPPQNQPHKARRKPAPPAGSKEKSETQPPESSSGDFIPAPEKELDLKGEQALLGRAQKTLADGDNPQKALSLVKKHAKQYPDGQLTDQRRVLRIRILEKMGRIDRAKRSARGFLETNPDSLVSDTVSRILSRLQNKE